MLPPVARRCQRQLLPRLAEDAPLTRRGVPEVEVEGGDRFGTPRCRETNGTGSFRMELQSGAPPVTLW